MNSTFLTVFVIGALAVVSPGPDFIIVARNSLLYSKRVGIATAFGIATGNLWWIAASILGISYVISRMVLAFTILKWAGALYLIYLGICALRSKGLAPETETIGKTRQVARRPLSTRQAFRIGLLTNILNPKCALFFVSFFSIITTPSTPLVLRYAYGFEIMIIAVTWFSLLATVLSVAKIKQTFKKVSIWLDRVTGAILIALGLKIAISKT